MLKVTVLKIFAMVANDSKSIVCMYVCVAQQNKL